MHKSNNKQTSAIASSELLDVFSSSWWQLDVNHRSLVAKHRESLHSIIARLFDSDLQIRVVRSEDNSVASDDDLDY